MKLIKLVLPALVAFTLASTSVAAQAPDFVEPPRLAAATILFSHDEKGVVTNAHVTAKFSGDSLLLAGKKATKFVTVEFDLVALGKQTVTINGVVSDYEDISAEFLAVCLKQYFIAHPAPLPVRKALRSPPPPAP